MQKREISLCNWYLLGEGISALSSGATLGVLTTPEQALCSGGLANIEGTPCLYSWVLLSSGWWVLFTVLRQRRNVKLSE